MSKYEALPTFSLDAAHCLYHSNATPELVHSDDPASTVVMDFDKTAPGIIAPDASITQAQKMMKSHQEHVLLVVDDNESVLGLISSSDLLGEKPIKIIQEGRVSHDDVKVKGIMQPRDELLCIDYNSLRYAKVGHLVLTLYQHHQSFALLVDNADDNPQTIRGLICASQIARKLHISAGEHLSEAETLAELVKRHS